MHKRIWITMLAIGMLTVFLWRRTGTLSRAEDGVSWLDGIWLDGKTMEETERIFGTAPVLLTLHLQEEQAVKVVVFSGEEQMPVPLQVETAEEGWLAEAEILPPEGSWRFCVLWEQEDGSEVPIYESGDFFSDRTAPETELWMEKQAADNGECASLVVGARVRELNWEPMLAELHLYRHIYGQEPGEEIEGFAEESRWQQVEEDVWEWQQEVTEEGIWKLTFQTTDLVGNRTEQMEKEETLDWSAPQLTDVLFTKDGTPVRPEQTAHMICREKLEGKLCLQDLWSGVAGCQIWARKTGEEKQLLKEWQAETPLAQAELSFDLEEEGEWTLWAKAWDAAENHWEEEKFLGTVRIDAASPEISLLVEGTEGEHGFYTGNVRLRLEAEDDGSGLEKIVLCADGEQRAVFSCDGQAWRQETVEVEDDEEGMYRWTLQVWDVAGNAAETETEVWLDGTAPRVELEAETLPVKTRGYYAQTRKIHVRVWETFPETPCTVDIYRQGERWQTVSCTAVGDGQYEGTVLAEEEGAYELQAVCRDLAGNEGEAALSEAFVIDRTAPQIHVSWEEASQQGQKKDDVWYTKGPRTALISITDAFPDEKDITCVVEKDGVQKPKSLQFSGTGTRRQARLVLEEEGMYRLLVSARDLAGNSAVPYESERFVLDHTSPVLSFGKGGGRDVSGKAEVSPWVRASDLYLKEQGLEVRLYCEGSAPGQAVQTEVPLHLPGETVQEEQENTFSYAPWPLQQRLDGCYRLEARAEDLAGNVQQEVWHFTVNRFGSVFVFGRELLFAEQKYYVNQKPSILIREYNPDSLVSRKILLESEAGIRALKEGRDYTTEQTYGSGQWNCYTYHFRPEVLEADGSYRLSIHTVDQAGNAMDTRKQQELAFFLDREAPVITVEQEKSGRKVNIDMRDLSGIETATFRMDGKEAAIYGREEIAEADGHFTLTVPSSRRMQAVTVEARDLAGNQTVTEPLSLIEETETDAKKTQSGQKKEKSQDIPAAAGETGTGTGQNAHGFSPFAAGFLLFLCVCLLVVVQICVKKREKKNKNC